MEDMVGVASLATRRVDLFREQGECAERQIIPDDLAKIGDPELIQAWLRKKGSIKMDEMVLVSER